MAGCRAQARPARRARRRHGASDARPCVCSFFQGYRQQVIAELLCLHRNTVMNVLRRFRDGLSLTKAGPPLSSADECASARRAAPACGSSAWWHDSARAFGGAVCLPRWCAVILVPSRITATSCRKKGTGEAGQAQA